MTITFETEIKNGTIAIPEKLRRQFKDKETVSVSVKMYEEVDEEPYDIISELIKNPIKVENFVPLTRDEIYDRKL